MRREELKQLLTFAVYKSSFISDGEYCTQIDDMMILLWDTF